MRKQSIRRERRIWVGLSLLFVVACGMVVLGIAHAISVVGSLLVLATLLLIRPHANAYVDRHVRLMRGTRAEEAVGDTLDELIREGWTVMHDIEQPFGNIDHLASGPAGVYLIETKARRYTEPQLIKVKRQAARVHDELRVWVTPVICLHQRDEQPRKAAGVVWVVPHQHLLDWLRVQRNPVVPFERLARFADSL